MSKNKGEPSLEKIDDFKGKESKSKRNTVRLVIISLLIIGIVLSYIKSDNSKVDDYIGVKDKPGIDISKK